jgi:hypothetical protein
LIIIELSQDLIDEFVISLEAQLLKGSLELLGVNNSTSVTVENVEGGFDVLDFFDGDDD